jgi:hydrogenase maturation protease
VDLIEALTLCQALDHVPETTIIGIEPQNLNTLNENLTPLIQSRLPALIEKVLEEIVLSGGTYTRKI